MKSKMIALVVSAITSATLFTACSKTDDKSLGDKAASQLSLEDKISENGQNPDEKVFSKNAGSSSPNHFYIESNRRVKNTILVFTQRQNGQLVLEDEVKSGGSGISKVLGSQGAIAVSRDYNLLFAVNAGSNTVSSFRINPNTGGLSLLFTANTNGQVPNSVTVHENKLYVLNNLTSTICGFTFTSNGFISMIPGSVHSLSTGPADYADAPQISFQPDGSALYVTEKKTNLIDKFTVDQDGNITSANFIQGYGIEPFGFDFGRNGRFLIVSNAANGFTGAGSATSYKIVSNSNGLVKVSGAIGDGQTAPCWVATTKNGAFAFVTNAASNNISSYYIDQNGGLTLIKTIAAQDGQTPLDIAVSNDNQWVYNIYSGSHSVVAYKRMSIGAIKLVDKVTSLPPFAAGLAVY